MTYKLYLDDLRNPPDNTWVVARSSDEAFTILLLKGLPDFMNLDHDLGGDDTTMIFLKKLSVIYSEGPVPEYQVHSANPVGRENIIGFIESWRRSTTM